MTPEPTGAPQPSQPLTVDPAVLWSDFGSAVRTTVDGARESAGRVTIVQGHATPGPAGILRAPFSGRPCVWYRTIRYPRFRWYELSEGVSPSRLPLPRIAPSYLPAGPGNQDVSSTTPFAVTDDGGSIAIDPAHTQMDTDVMSVNDQVHGDVLVEWIVPVDAPLLVVGSVVQPDDGYPWLAHPAGVPLVSTKEEQWIGARTRAAVGLDPTVNAIKRRALTLGLTIGLIVFAVCLIPLILALLL